MAVETRIVALVGSGSQSIYALQCALALGTRKMIMINRGKEHLERVMKDFADTRVVGRCCGSGMW